MSSVVLKLKKEEVYGMTYCIITRDDPKSKSITKELKSKINAKYDEDFPKCVIAVGGDGTLLRAFHLYPNSIIFGLHTGHLGFYSNYFVSDIDVIANAINEDKYSRSYKNIKVRCLYWKNIL